jgi:hypothetical protein
LSLQTTTLPLLPGEDSGGGPGVVSPVVQPPPDNLVRGSVADVQRPGPHGAEPDRVDEPRAAKLPRRSGSLGERLSTLPAFFIVGAPRCGTTLLSTALSKNPQICFSRPKEPHFFGSLGNDIGRKGLETAYYQRHFRHLTDEHRVWGEGSVSYLYSREALEQILAAVPHARFIVHVRNPVDMVESYHRRMLFLLYEDREDLAEAWRLRERRRRGEVVPTRCPDPRLLDYGDIGRLGHYVEQLFATVGRERCMVVMFDDIARDPLAVYRQALAFVGAEYDGRTKFPRRNPTKGFKSRTLQGLFISPPGWVQQVARRIDLQSGWARHLNRMRKRFKRTNTVVVERLPLNPELREELRLHYASEVQRLGELLERDLSHWR